MSVIVEVVWQNINSIKFGERCSVNECHDIWRLDCSNALGGF